MRATRRVRPRRWAGRLLLILAATTAAVPALYLVGRPNGDILWKIMASRCGLEPGGPSMVEPCLLADRSAGYVILRDRKGSHHYLLLPTRPLAGMESPALLDPLTPNYFSLAWENRRLVSGDMPGIADDNVLLAVNSRYGRSQDQLHIHISCVTADVAARLAIVAPAADGSWRPVPGGLSSHDYWIRRVSEEDLRRTTPFRLAAAELPHAADDLGRFALAMTSAPAGGFLLLATRLSLLDLNLASAEELQDHSCRGDPA